jgi:hypothetical protein
MHGIRLATGLIGLMLLASVAPAQQSPPEKDTSAEPAHVTMGKRVLAMRLKAQRVSTLVIASDTASYVDAIGRWTLERRFPVLIDDGTPGARHNIARFIHGYQPEQILYYDAEAGEPTQESIYRTIASAWGASEGQPVPERWAELEFVPPGVVVASMDDPAWTAALALSADRGQPIVWLNHRSGTLNSILPEDNASEWRRTLREQIDALGYAWSGLGDAIDSLTVCLTMPTKVKIDDRIMAMTDYLARNDDASSWGACGMIFGTESEAAFRAMSAVFLQPRSVWFFDGYEGNFGAEYAMDRAAGFFRQAGFDRVLADPRPNAGRQIWRMRQRAGVDAGLVFVNTRGHARWFDLAGDRAYGSDVPFLRQPAAVHFIHSFSAQVPDNPESISARWLDQGAFVYYGSADEPGLQAFLTPEQVTGRVLTGVPMGFAFRYDSSNMIWKVNYFGDPLFTLGNIPKPIDEPITLEGATDLSERMRSTLRDQNFADGIASLVMLGEHANVVRICTSLLASKPDVLTPDVIETALLSHFYERDYAGLAALYERLPADRRDDARNTTMLWHALRPELDRATPEQLSLLRLTIRQESADEDAAALAPALRRAFGENAVRSMYAQLISEADNDQMREKLQRAMP